MEEGYQFYFSDGELEVTMDVPMDITASQLKKKLKNFLITTGYSTQVIDTVFGEDDED